MISSIFKSLSHISVRSLLLTKSSCLNILKHEDQFKDYKWLVWFANPLSISLRSRLLTKGSCLNILKHEDQFREFKWLVRFSNPLSISLSEAVCWQRRVVWTSLNMKISIKNSNDEFDFQILYPYLCPMPFADRGELSEHPLTWRSV